MKIHTRVVTCMTTGEVLEDNYYEYEGPVELCKGSGEIEETAEETVAAEISDEKWKRYQDVFVPLENQYMQKVDNFRSDANYDKVGGMVSSGVKSGMGQAIADNNTAMFQGGINPNSGKFKGANTALMTKGSKVLSDAVNNANLNLGTEQLNRMEGLVKIGQGQSADTTKSMNQIAKNSASIAGQDAEDVFNRYSATAETIGTGIGAGSRMYANQTSKPQGLPQAYGTYPDEGSNAYHSQSGSYT
jgi:hypothetical protein